MKFTKMDTPMTRREFERRFHITAELMMQGKVHFSSHLKNSIEGLLEVRKTPNGRIDFLSVDEMTRLNVNMMTNVSDVDFSRDYNK
ncbi:MULTISPECIES: AVAST type 1 anti-phage system protein Avs1c [Priestia]|uniref:AVAST type 1 anti-phage system protein Avs1c n=1 Tax=Priestia TaxID=2800373 RepID=UPI0030EC4CC8